MVQTHDAVFDDRLRGGLRSSEREIAPAVPTAASPRGAGSRSTTGVPPITTSDVAMSPAGNPKSRSPLVYAAVLGFVLAVLPLSAKAVGGAGTSVDPEAYRDSAFFPPGPRICGVGDPDVRSLFFQAVGLLSVQSGLPSGADCSQTSTLGANSTNAATYSFGKDTCKEEFVPDQGRRMRCTLMHWRPDLAEVVPGTWIFQDGFESGDSSAWGG